MKLLCLLFTNLFAFLLLTRVRRAIALTLVGAVALTGYWLNTKGVFDFDGTPALGEPDERKGPYRTPRLGEVGAAKVERSHIIAHIAKVNFGKAVTRLDTIYKDLRQQSFYALMGPNSNTYAKQLLTLAGFAAPTVLPVTAPGWGYNGDLRYAGKFYDKYGNVTDKKGLREWYEVAHKLMPFVPPNGFF